MRTERDRTEISRKDRKGPQSRRLRASRHHPLSMNRTIESEPRSGEEAQKRRLCALPWRALREIPSPSPASSAGAQPPRRLLPNDTILEFKSTGRPYRARNLDRLWAYLHLHFTDEPKRLEQRSDLCGALLVPARTPSLDIDVGSLGLTWHDRGAGYWELTGGPFALYVLEIDTVAEAEDDDLRRSFGHDRPHTQEGKRWLSEQTGSTVEGMKMSDLEGYTDAFRKVLEGLSPEQRLAGLAPEQRVAGLAPEQRVADLTAEQRLVLLPDDALRAFPDTYLATLSEPTRAAIRARIGR